jgi:hypothetical protein
MRRLFPFIQRAYFASAERRENWIEARTERWFIEEY